MLLLLKLVVFITYRMFYTHPKKTTKIVTLSHVKSPTLYCYKNFTTKLFI